MVNIVGVRMCVPPPVGGPATTDSKMTARAVLQCRPNSHPFPERTLVLDQPVKIGRSVARARPATSNAIFDCKVLSRNHALLWYENGKFYLQDTKSSNGTFVNNQRLSKGSEESAPREVCSGDIVQFGVDVMENSRKVTHGCIVATLKLYMPDGQEAKASPSTAVGGAVSSVSAQELYQLRTYLQEAQHREQQIENKLATLQRLVSSTQEAATHGWKAMIDEDRLLQRLETLETQLTTYAKNYPEDSLREEMRRLLEEKCEYEMTAKESLRRVLKEKLDASAKLTDLERTLSTSEDELSRMKEMCESTQKELEDLLEKQALQSEHVMLLTEKLKAAEEQLRDSEDNFEQERKEMVNKIVEKSSEENKLLARIESLAAENDFTKEQLSALKAKFENMKNGELSGLLKPRKNSGDLDLLSIDTTATSDTEMKHTSLLMENAHIDVHTLRECLKTTQEELRQAEANVSQLKHEAQLADSVEARCVSARARLFEELSDTKVKLARDTALTEHLQSQLATLQDRLHSRSDNSSDAPPKIYDDIYDEDDTADDKDTSTLVRRKKDKEKVNDDDDDGDGGEGDSKDCSKGESEGDTTLTIIKEYGGVNGSVVELRERKDEEDESEVIRESLLYSDIHTLQELLSVSKASQRTSQKEVERVRGELAQASTAAVTATHEAANLKQQLAASEAVMGEKVRVVTALQNQVSQLERSSQEVCAQLSDLAGKLREEQLRVQTAQEETQTLRNKLSEAEELAQGSVEEARSLRSRILGLEDRLQFSQTVTNTPLILPPPSTQDSLTPPASIDAPPLPSNQQEEEVAMLKDTVQKLKDSLDKAQRECTALKDVTTTTTTLEKDTDSRDWSSLKEELEGLKEERDRLKDRLSIMNEDYEVLSVQSKMSVPTWVVLVVVMAVAVASDLYLTAL